MSSGMWKTGVNYAAPCILLTLFVSLRLYAAQYVVISEATGEILRWQEGNNANMRVRTTPTLLLSCVQLSCVQLLCATIVCNYCVQLLCATIVFNYCVQLLCEQLSCVQLSCVQLSCVQLSCVKLSCVQLLCVQLSCVKLSCVQLSCVQLSYVQLDVICVMATGNQFYCCPQESISFQVILTYILYT
jgi:hypothetical protein